MKHFYFFLILFLMPIQIGLAKQNSSNIQVSFTIKEFCQIEKTEEDIKILCSHNSPYKIIKNKEQNKFPVIYF